MIVCCLTSCLGKISLTNYLDDLDNIRASSDVQFAKIKSALQQVKSGDEAVKSLYQDIATAESSLKKDKARIEKLKPPDAARKLHNIVVSLYGQAAVFFGDMLTMIKYTVEREPPIAVVESASTDLDSRISKDNSTQSVSAALTEAAAKVDASSQALTKLSPPPFLKSVHDALLNMLKQYSASLVDLKNAVESGNAAAITEAQQRIRASLSTNLSEQTKRSVEEYNSAILKIEEFRKEANREESRITTE